MNPEAAGVRLRVLPLLALLRAAGHPGHRFAASTQDLQVRIVEPAPDRAAVGATLFKVQVQAPAGRQVVQVSLWVDGHRIATLDTAPWQAVFDAGDTLRPHTLRAEARDDTGAVAADLASTLYISYVEEVEVIGAAVPRHALSVGVLDRRRQPVTGLPPDAFSLLLQRRPEPLLSALPDRRPLAVEILLDISGTTFPYWPQIREAAARFVGELGPQDGSEVLVFAGDVGRIVSFTRDHEHARARILATSGNFQEAGFSFTGTRLYDALAAGIEEINARPGQRSLVVLTDAQDSGSLLDYQQIAQVVRRAGIRLDVVRFGRRSATSWSAATRMVKRLRHLARESGGMEWVVRDAEEIPGLLQLLARQLRTRYRLVFAPELTAAQKAVPVRVKVPQRQVMVLAPSVLFTSPRQPAAVGPAP